MALVIVGVVLFLVAAGLWWGAGSAQRRGQALAATETSTCGDLATSLPAAASGDPAGRQVEVCGTAKPGPVALTGPFSERACVWYRTTVTEHYREYEWRGSDQNHDRRRELVDKSRQVSDEVSKDPFLLDDGTGTITVEVDGADIDRAPQVIDRRVVDDSGWAGRMRITLGPITFAGAEGVTGYQHEEWIIPTDTQLFVTGEASRDGNGLRVGRPSASGLPYIVSTRTEAELQASAASSAKWMRIGMIASAVAGLLCITFGVLS